MTHCDRHGYYCADLYLCRGEDREDGEDGGDREDREDGEDGGDREDGEDEEDGGDGGDGENGSINIGEE